MNIWRHLFDVAQLCLIDGLVEAEAVGDLPVARVTQHDRAATDQHRNFSDRELESVE